MSLVKNIVLGITGSIASYKVPQIIRDFQKAGFSVRVVGTEASKEFVSPLVIEGLTRFPFITNMFDDRLNSTGPWHIELAH